MLFMLYTHPLPPDYLASSPKYLQVLCGVRECSCELLLCHPSSLQFTPITSFFLCVGGQARPFLRERAKSAPGTHALGMITHLRKRTHSPQTATHFYFLATVKLPCPFTFKFLPHKKYCFALFPFTILLFAKTTRVEKMLKLFRSFLRLFVFFLKTDGIQLPYSANIVTSKLFCEF